MTIEIIKRGELPAKQRKYEANCRKCQTIFSFAEEDANRIPDMRDGDYLVIRCPVCQHGITKAVQ